MNLHKNSYKLLIITISYILLFSGQYKAQIQTDVPHLKDVYKNDFYIGCLLSYPEIGFDSDPYVPGQSPVVDANGGYLIQYHMNSMSPGVYLKAENIVDITASDSEYNAAATQEEKDSIDVHPVISFNGNIIAQLNWAKRQGFTFRGHTLVWNQSTPTEFFLSGYTSTGTRLSKEKMADRLENYIKEVIRKLHEGWPGLLSAYDVVNEAVSDSGTDRTDSEWYQTFGDNSYIMKAFESARKYTQQYDENQIKLYYNDYNTYSPAKADRIVRICGPIFRAGYLDGIGMQEHNRHDTPTAQQWIASYNKFDTVCTEMAVTELDVSTGKGPYSLVVQANQYGQLFKCFVARSYFSGRGKIISISLDGLNDQWTSYTGCSLWDYRDQCKPSFYVVANVGLNYNKLDSLITFADSLDENEYTTSSWNNLNLALTYAQGAKDSNYTWMTSVADTLGKAVDSMSAAIDSLKKIITDVAEVSATPRHFELFQNYPNPFNPSTTIKYSVAKASFVTMKIYDLLGREVASLVNEEKTAGSYQVKFDANNIASGIYFYKIKAGSFEQVKKMILLR